MTASPQTAPAPEAPAPFTRRAPARRRGRLRPDRSGLAQLVVMLVAGSVAVVAAVSITVERVLGVRGASDSIHRVQIGPWTTYVSHELPDTRMVAAALIGIALVAVCAVTLEVGATLLLSLNPRRRALAAQRAGGSTSSPRATSAVTVTVVVPAHNEEDVLPGTLESLARQSRAPDQVIVVADNCDDRTVEIAHTKGATVFETVANRQKKAGALNQLLNEVLRGKGAGDAVLILDADTALSPRFIEEAARRLEEDAELAAVGARFTGDAGGGVLGQFQRNEFRRYSRQITSRRGRVFVLTGTATMFRADALLDVAAARGLYLPGEAGRVYDTLALTEDNELTLALKSLGAEMTSPMACTVVTEIMPTWGALWRQRKRWQRGALENLSAYGITASTARYWGQQFGIGYGVLALNAAMLLMLITLLAVDPWVWFPFWIVVTLVFVAERVLSAWAGGWRARLLAVLLFPELGFDLFLQAVFVVSLYEITFNRRAAWGHAGEASAP